MDLSPKANRFVIEALEHYLAEHERRLAEKGLSDDDTADLVNDAHYLRAILTDFKNHHDEMARTPGQTKASA
jgi:hypothetical protein